MRTRIPTFILVFFSIDFVLALAYVFNYVIGSPYWIVTAFLDLDGEHNLPTWYSSIQWFCVAALLGIFACRNFNHHQARSWLLIVLPLVFMVLSLDEVAQIHEWLGHKSDILLPHGSRNNTLFPRTGIWMFVVGIPFLVLFGALVFSIRVYFRHVPGSLVKMILGMAITLAGGVGIETLYNFVDANSAYEMLEALLEESCEMAGSTVILWGGYELLREHNFVFSLDKAETNHPVG